MIEIQNKKIYFAGRGDRVDKSELDRFIIQNDAELVDNINEADIIIEGMVIPSHIEDMIYEQYKEGKPCIYIQDFEKFFSQNVEVDSIIMAVKISKDKSRIIKLLQNEYFSDEIYLKIASCYDFGSDDLYDNDENRDVCITIVERFCELVKTNHNIQYSPIGIYYTVLEASNPKLLELIYNMPSFEISDKNIKPDQPTKLKEVVALNPNTSKQLQIHIFKNGDLNELKFLSMNESLFIGVKKSLIALNNDEITLSLIKAGNFSEGELKEQLKNPNLKQKVLEFIKLDRNIFDEIMSTDLNQDELFSLSQNESLTKPLIDKLFKIDDKDVKINLLSNSNLSQEIKDEYIKSQDTDFLSALSFNESLSEEEFKTLFFKNFLEVDIALSYNPKTPLDIFRELAKKQRFEINSALASNEFVPLDVLLQFQFDYRVKPILGKNEAYKEYTKRTIL